MAGYSAGSELARVPAMPAGRSLARRLQVPSGVIGEAVYDKTLDRVISRVNLRHRHSLDRPLVKRHTGFVQLCDRVDLGRHRLLIP
jgi:hypothetical protein